ncbi:YlzJ-like family protein [Hydrogenoanaerobacterium sp.]|uniref:YlzJ-like family protein n=1 Tax=Hydrogenoanaerobacterium sp. TaxID=2953763 RepID=UPI00289E110E|nr:YlzJ-like family protein [Hydrogenoanaerobacterium sp.]
MTHLHTVVPIEQVFPSEPAKTEMVSVGSTFIEGMRGENGIQITRLISTDPKMYLDERYAPGQNYRDR